MSWWKLSFVILLWGFPAAVVLTAFPMTRFELESGSHDAFTSTVYAGKRSFAGVSARRDAIHDELQTISEHDWAGSYFEGDGYVMQHIAVAPKNGATYVYGHCTDLFADGDHGPVKEIDGGIRVAWALSSIRRTDFVVIRWGERRYLMIPEAIPYFCAAVRSGDEPRTEAHGDFFLRAGDESLQVQGDPQLPPGFEKCLREGAITTQIKEVRAQSEENHEDAPRPGTFVTLLVTLNVGDAEGVLPGLKFEAKELEDLNPEVVVTAVRQHESDATVKYYWRKGTIVPPATDWKLATKR